MVAQSPFVADRFVAAPPGFLSGRSRLMRFTRDDVEALVRLGIVPEDASTELLQGILVHTDRSACGEDPLSVGDDHTKCVELLSNLRISINSEMRHARSQQPLICDDDAEPQPDFMILRGTIRDYSSKPIAADAFCVIEVADSSYERDSGFKLAGYARAGIPQYIIINLRNRTAEVYTKPDTAAGTYAAPVIITEKDALSVRVGESEMFEIRLEQLLP
jgi:Uma2 family endonuclease